MESVKFTSYFYPDGNGPKGIEYEDWYLDSPAEYIRHRTDGPARIIYYTCGKIWSKHWYLYGKEHRDSEPAIIYYYKSGKIKSEEWYLNGNEHRTDGPAFITYYESGKVRAKCWYLNSQLHREDGPTYIKFSLSGKIETEHWYLNDERIHPEEWLLENEYSWPLNNNQQIELLLKFG